MYEGLQIKNGEKTFFWSGKYHQDMNTRDTLDTQLNVLESFDPIVPKSYQDCDILNARKPNSFCSNEGNSANGNSSKINRSRYYELLDGDCYGRLEEGD